MTTLSQQQPEAVAEALQGWQHDGKLPGLEHNGDAGSTGLAKEPADEVDGGVSHELQTFESPMGGQYIYDRTG